MEIEPSIESWLLSIDGLDEWIEFLVHNPKYNKPKSRKALYKFICCYKPHMDSVLHLSFL